MKNVQKSFTINGKTFSQEPNSPYFILNNNPKRKFSAWDALAAAYPTVFGQFKFQFLMPQIFEDLSPAARRRAQKIIEHHFYPHIELNGLDAAADLIEAGIGLKAADDMRLASTYTAAMQATGNDREQAAALIIAFGDTQITGSKITRSCMYQLLTDDNGIKIIINYPQPLEERVEHAVSEMHIYANYLRSVKQPLVIEKLVAKGMRAVTTYSGYTISYTGRFYMSMRALLVYYAERFADNKPPEQKLIRLPYNLIEPQIRSVKWEDIRVLEGFAATRTGKRIVTTILEKTAKYPRNLPIHAKYLKQVLTEPQFRRALDVGIIEQLDELHYKIVWPSIALSQYSELLAAR